MIRTITKLFSKAQQIKPTLPQASFIIVPQYRFNSLVDKMQKKQSEKSQQQVRKEIEHLANKPTFTLMDYKQRILDELNKIKSSIRAKMSSQTQQQQKELEVQRKVLSCLYEEQLNEEYQLRHSQRKAISLVSQVDYNQVTEIFKKASRQQFIIYGVRYQKMHGMLRAMKQRGDPLPKDMQELNYLYVKSGLEFQGPKQKYLKYEKRSRIERGRYIKWGTHQ